jgi:hypothetical protein
MNFEGLIEFNKYTMALAAACFVYTLETFVPAAAESTRWLVLVLLALFLAAAVFGVLIFAACTKALHNDAAARNAAAKRLPLLGTIHAVLLGGGLVLLGVMVVPRVLAAPVPAAPMVVACRPATVPPAHQN